MAALTKGVFIVAAKRTPFGTFGGKFLKLSSCDLQEVASKAALSAGKISPDIIDSVVIGNVLANTSSDSIFHPRHVLLRCGIPQDRPALGVNRLCGSGFQSIINGAQVNSLSTTSRNLLLIFALKMMAQIKLVAQNDCQSITPSSNSLNAEDQILMGQIDLLLVDKDELLGNNNVKRLLVELYSFKLLYLFMTAHGAGVFKEELAPVNITIRKKQLVVDTDEHPKPNTTLETLTKLSPVFKENGVVTAGSASGICDGAGCVILASEEAIKKHNLKPLSRLVGYAVVGVDPSIMGIGPVPAIKRLLSLTGKELKDIDLIEINEAFSAQTLACVKELKLDIDKLNVNGGAVALGHPLAASGSRITTHLVHELRRKNLKLGIGSACIGGGQGIALLIEKM
uniref:Uncharacterized protein n=1 Tax=Rhodnius prolixus TaxID=13249 RepID=T1HLM2_RHOPR